MASTAGLKVGARRTAFGDVTNNLRPAADTNTSSFKPYATAAQGKENSSYRGFLAPAQRPKHHSSIAVVSSFHPDTDVEGKARPFRGVGDSHAQPVVKKSLAKRATIIYNDNGPDPAGSGLFPEVAGVGDRALRAPQGGQRKSPRHAKSQPHLKSDPPLLRRTQSRIIRRDPRPDDLITLAHEDVAEAPYVDAVEEFRPLEWPACDDLDGVAIQEDGMEESSLEMVDMVDYRDRDPQPKESTAPTSAVTEIEEYWEDDEEFYDEQGYTTAHSYRSLGDNTTGGATTLVVPKATAKVQKELDVARAIVESRLTPEDLQEEAWDVSMVAEYGEEIYEYMKGLEVSWRC